MKEDENELLVSFLRKNGIECLNPFEGIQEKFVRISRMGESKEEEMKRLVFDEHKTLDGLLHRLTRISWKGNSISS
jgi:aspartate aminotransferase-like enzyme